MKETKRWLALRWTTLAGVCLFGVCLVAFVAPARAQNYYNPGLNPLPIGGTGGYPYYPYPSMGNLGPGYFLQGAANVVGSTGDLYVKQEQARVTREQANQAKIDTKRKTFDEMRYEKANTPYYTETLEQNESFRLRRIMNNATDAEIKSGTAMNTILPYLRDLTNHGVMGPSITLDQDNLRHINVVGAGETGSLGLLANGGKMDWPFVLRGPTQKALAKLLPQVVAATSDGTLDSAMYGAVKKEVAKLEEEQRKKFHREEIDGGEYLVGKRFTDSLDGAIKLLQQPNAQQLLTGALKATGRTIPELVQNMSQKGLKFAPAAPGYEAPYYGLFNSMVSYASGAMGTSSFRVAVAPARPRSFISKTPNISGN